MIAITSQATWFVARGSGAVCLILLTISLVLGIPTMLSWGTPRVTRLVVQLLHRNVSLLILVFLVIHVLSSVLDSFVDIRLADAIVPFGASYRPIWLGLGAIAADLLLAVIITSVVRRHLSYRTWKLVHWSAYACWPIAVIHGLGTGSDRRFGWMLAIDAVCTAAVVAAVAWRLAARPRPDPAAAPAVLVRTSR
jgi:methionine sulfoxide reductase heme-binding subunit